MDIPVVCNDCATGPLSAQGWKRLMDGGRSEETSYCRTVNTVRAGNASGCALCALLNQHIYRLPESDAQIRFMLKIDREGDNFSPYPKCTPRLLIEASNSSMYTEYCLYTSPDNPASCDIISRPPLSQVASDEAYHHALERLNECITTHDKCPKPGSNPLPTRVIDCKNPSKPSLFITQGASSPYLALSYVWGSNASHITLKSNVDQYIAGIDPQVIPKTISDAITVTHKLGMRYLWVDAFCIIQDSDDDKNNELVRMGQIYRDAYVTIIAASASNGNAGILHDRPLPAGYSTHTRLPYHCRDGRVGSVFVYTSDEPDYMPMKDPVEHRAWCLQERLLSPRKLVYATDALEYHCQTTTVSVNNSLKFWGLERLNNLVFAASDTAIGARVAVWTDKEWGMLQVQWVAVLSSYTRRALSYRQDKLIAFAGIAEQFERVWRAHAGRYVAGLWEKHLPRDLLWFREPWEHGWLDDPLRLRAADDAYVAPSWSWASVEGHIRVKPPVDCENKACDVLACNVTLVDERLPYGRVSAGRIKLRAVVVPFPVVVSHATLDFHYKLFVPTDEIWARVAAAPEGGGIVAGSDQVKKGEKGEESTRQITVSREQLSNGLLAASQSTHMEGSLLKPVGPILLAFDSPERGDPSRTWAILVYREDAARFIHTEGLIVTDVGSSIYRRLGHWRCQRDEKDIDVAKVHIPWIRSDVEKRVIELV